MFDVIVVYALPLIAIIEAIVLIHIIGHFIWCRCFAIKVELVSFGFGPTLLKFTKGSTTWRISWFPIGGYIKPRYDGYSAGTELHYVGAALSGSILSILAAWIVVFVIVLTYGFPVNQNHQIHLTHLSHYDSLIITLRLITLTWVNWNTSSWGWVLGSYTDNLARLSFLGAIWSSQLGVLNLIPFPRFDGWEVLKITVIRTVGETKTPATLEYIYRCMVAILIISFLLFNHSWGHVTLPTDVEAVHF